MKKLVVWTLLAVMFFATLTAGCGGGGDSSDTGQTESLNDDTGSTDPNSGGRGTSDKVINLSTLTEHYTAHNGEILIGTLGSPILIRVPDGAAITLRDVTINGVHVNGRPVRVGFDFEGDATLILEGTNNVKSVNPNYSAIGVPEGHTLTITGTGALTADASDCSASAGIGGGYTTSCGNILIEGGTIEARGGFMHGAGIGGGNFGNCGDITIKGGAIIAKGGLFGAGIGSGEYSNCGNITITKNVTKVTATKGELAPYSIGAGSEGGCGTVTIGDDLGQRSDPTCTYPPDMQ